MVLDSINKIIDPFVIADEDDLKRGGKPLLKLLLLFDRDSKGVILFSIYTFAVFS